MKKFASLVLCILMILSMATACSDGTNDTASSSQETPVGEETATNNVEFIPEKNIETVVPFSAGGNSDLLTRNLLNLAADQLPSGINFTVSNITGSGGLVGLGEWMKMDHDGYHLGIVNCDHVLSRALGATDVVVEDNFIPIVRLQCEPHSIIVRSDSDVNDLTKFIEKCKSGKNAVTIATSGANTPSNLVVLALEKYFNVEIKEVAYSGAPDCMVAVMSGEADATVCTLISCAGQVEAGELISIGVTSPERTSALPDVPSIGEVYPEAAEMDIPSWITLAVSKDAPAEQVKWLQDTLIPVLESEEYAQVATDFYMSVNNATPDEIIQFWKDQFEIYSELMAG